MSAQVTDRQVTRPVNIKPRHHWMDMRRGLGVLLIVLVHSGSFYSAMARLALPEWIRVLDFALAPYRIPMLVFLSGIFLTRSLAKGLVPFSMGKIRNLVWPFLVWTLIGVTAAAGPRGLLDLKVWLTGGPALWYLSFLAVYFAIGLAFARVPFLIIAIYALAISMVAPDESRYGSRLFLLMSYFFVGGFAGQHMDRFHALIKNSWMWALVPIVIALSYYFTTQPPGFKYSPYVAPLAIACIICMACVINALSSGRIASALQFAGRNSLIYYVVHPTIYILLYKFLFSQGIFSPYVCIILALGLAISAATVLAHLKERSRAINLLFEGPAIPVSATLRGLADKAERILMPQYRFAAPPSPPPPLMEPAQPHRSA